MAKVSSVNYSDINPKIITITTDFTIQTKIKDWNINKTLLPSSWNNAKIASVLKDVEDNLEDILKSYNLPDTASPWTFWKNNINADQIEYTIDWVTLKLWWKYYENEKVIIHLLKI